MSQKSLELQNEDSKLLNNPDSGSPTKKEYETFPEEPIKVSN